MNIKNAKRIVIKIGSALIADAASATLNSKWLDGLIDDVSSLRKTKKDVVIVSSGAVALGRNSFKTGKQELRLEEKQAAAACGQLALAQGYKESLARHKLRAAQVLLTIGDTEDRRRYLNARNTLETLIETGIIPVINENDTVATAEIRFGDNDRLAARVAQMVGADLLILLSDIDGLYTANPKVVKNSSHIARVEVINEEIEQMADGKGSDISSGGMITKIAAAKIAVASGCATIIAKGDIKNPVSALEKGEKHTLFISAGTPKSARKNWIAHNLNVTGDIVIDAGAAEALAKGNSLLPAGVKAVKGDFIRGDAVTIKDENNNEIGRGLIAYSAKDAMKIIGKKSTEIDSILGFKGREELIHRDDMALL